MNLTKLFKMQKELDERIYAQHELNKEELLDKKVLALQVELGELANETRCFKYWSKKPASERVVILEEYSDYLHFILSIGNLLGYTDYEYKPSELKHTLTEMFIGLLSYSALLLSKDKKIFEQCFTRFIDLGYALGFSWDEVEQAYIEKNMVNHERQDNHY